MGLLLSLADDRPDAAPSKHVLAAYRRLAPWLDPASSLRDTLGDPRRALGLGAQAVALAASLARLTALPPDPLTSLSRPLTGRRRAAWSRGIALGQVRTAARARGGTINDLVMAAVSGALRQHLVASGDPTDVGLRALVPVNLRPGLPDVAGGMGNRFGLVFVDLPTDLRTSAARHDAVRARTAVVKARLDALATFGVLGALGRAPLIQPWATRFFSRKASVVVTNVPGPATHLHLAGRRVEQAMFWVPHPATLGVGISVLSYAGELRIGVRSDTAVLPRPADLVEHFEEELAALGAG